MNNAAKCITAAILILILPVFPAPAAESPAASTPALDIMLVLDDSGSMKKNDPDFLMRDVVMNFLAGFGEETRLGMVVFNQSARLLQPLTQRSEPENRTRFLKDLESIDYRGQWSDTPAGVERALYELTADGRDGVSKALVLLTDGIVDTGNPVVDAEKRTWLKSDLTAACQKAGVRIFGIAFTEGADFSLIQTLANRTDGEYYRATHANEIAGVFQRIHEALTYVPPPPEPVPPTPQPVKKVAEKPLPKPAPPVQPPKPAASPTTVPESKTDLGPLAMVISLAAMAVALLVWVLARRRTVKNAVDMPRADLVDINNVTGKKTIPLVSAVTRIGRDAGNQIPISRDTVSSLHAVIEYRNGSFFVEDQRSRNGTRLNGEPLPPGSAQRLKSGDEISFHTHAFRFLLPDMQPAGETVMDFDADAFLRPESLSGEAQPQALLVDMKNITGRKTLKLTGQVNRIGRSAPSDLVIAQKSISGVHATIEFKDGRFYLEDLRSKNGTRLNGEELAPNGPKKLKSGDEITFDVYPFLFMLENQVPSGDTGETWMDDK